MGPLLRAPSPIVLSFGLGDDISFDREVSKVFGAKVFGFDPTPASLDWIAAQELPPTVRIYPLGISNFDGEQTFAVSEDDTRSNFSTKLVTGKSIVCNVRRYSTILDTLGLATIDVLKLDVEGAEHDVLPEVLGSDVLPRQILVEFHHWWHRTPVEQTYRTVEAIKGQALHPAPCFSCGPRIVIFADAITSLTRTFDKPPSVGGIVGNNLTPRLPGDPRCRPNANRFSAGIARAALISRPTCSALPTAAWPACSSRRSGGASACELTARGRAATSMP